MASSVFLLLVCLILGNMETVSPSLRQETDFISLTIGENLTLRCFCEGDYHLHLCWYKQTLAQKPQLISRYTILTSKSIFYDEFKNNPRVTLDTESGKKHLSITDVRPSDSATYFCVSVYGNTVEFAEGTTVSVKSSGLNIPALVHQSASETSQPGGSVTLNCTVHTGTCDGENSVYWFKSSEESHPGLIYTHGGRNDQCEKKPHTQTHTCVYNMAMESLNVSHAGTYYCAVVSCGHIVFGNGTTLTLRDKLDGVDSVTFVFVCTALMFAGILVVLLSISIFKMKQRNSCQSIASQGIVPASSTANAEDNREDDNIHYAALSVRPANRLRRQWNNSADECVYSSVKK